MENAFNASLAEINKHLEAFDSEGETYVHCAGGYRSMIATSILKSRGIHNIVELEGGFKAIKETKVPLRSLVSNS